MSFFKPWQRIANLVTWSWMQMFAVFLFLLFLTRMKSVTVMMSVHLILSVSETFTCFQTLHDDNLHWALRFHTNFSDLGLVSRLHGCWKCQTECCGFFSSGFNYLIEFKLCIIVNALIRLCSKCFSWIWHVFKQNNCIFCV